MAKFKHEEYEVDHSTGEVKYYRKSFNIKAKSEEFYMTFIEYMSPIFGIKSPIEQNILNKFCSLAEFNTGKVILSSIKRKEICEQLNIELQTFNNSLLKLKRLGLINGARGEYEINPKIFWKGTTDARAKLLKEKGLEINIKFNADYDKDDQG